MAAPQAQQKGDKQPKAPKKSSRSLVWRESRPPDDGDDWITTYADAVTLLMAFFVIMFAVSEPNQGKFDEVRNAMVAEFRGEDVATTLEEATTVLIAQAEETGMADVISFVQEKRGIVITINSNALYAPGSADLQPAAVPLLDPIVERVNLPAFEAYEVEVEGHTDDQPVRNPQFASNWELSASRATNVVRYLVFRGVGRDRVRAVAYADTQPRVPNRDILGREIAENMAQNRRIVIRIKQ